MIGGLFLWQRSSQAPAPNPSPSPTPAPVVKKGTGDKMIKVGVSHYVSHPVMDAVVDGIKLGFQNAGYIEGKDIQFDRQNAQGEAAANQQIAQKFASSDYDIFMPIGTPPAQALVKLIKDRPVIFGAVTDPVAAELVQSLEQPGANVTGSSDITLYKEHLELLKRLVPNVKTVGIVYSPGEVNAQAGLKEVEKIAPSLGLTIKTAGVSSSGEILTAARSLASKVDAFYMLADNVVVSGQEAYIRVALENKKPIISLDQSGVEKGALATVGTNYRMLGERTAEMAVRVLQGIKPTDMPVLGIRDADLFLNTKTASAIGVKINQDDVDRAKQVYK